MFGLGFSSPGVFGCGVVTDSLRDVDVRVGSTSLGGPLLSVQIFAGSDALGVGVVPHDYNPSDLGVLDEVGALLAGLVGHVKSCSPTRSQACLKNRVVLCVNGETRELIVIGACGYVLVTELPPGATTVTTV